MKSEENDLWGGLFKVETKASTMVEDGSFGEPKMSISLSSEGVKDKGIEISLSSGRAQRRVGVFGVDVFVGRSGSLSMVGSPENRFNSRNQWFQPFASHMVVSRYGLYKNTKILKLKAFMS